MFIGVELENMMLISILVIVICIILAVFFIKAGNYESKIKTLEKKISENKVEKKPVEKKKNDKGSIIKNLKIENKKLKKKFDDNEGLVKENQQLRNQMAELEEKNKLIQGNKKDYHKQREEYKKELEKKDKKISSLKKENKELKNNFNENKKIRSYNTILKEALILQTFSKNDTQRFIQILHNFSDISEKKLSSYIEHLCDLDLLKKVDEDTFKRNFSIKKDEHFFDKIIYKIFDCDLQNLKDKLE